METLCNLTSVECEILKFLANGEQQKDIAEKIGISQSAAGSAVKKIVSKLDAKNKTEAVAIAVRKGYII